MNFIQTVAQLLGTYLERYIVEEESCSEEYTSQIERMHKSIFHSLNRSFYVPLEGIVKVNSQVQQESTDPRICSLANQIEQFLSKIKFTVDNIITISELESGFVHFDKKKNSVKGLIDCCLQDVKAFTNGHLIKLELPSQPLFS